MAASTVVAGVVVAPAAEAGVPSSHNWIGGKDLYATSVLMSQQLPRASTVYLTSGESGGDALPVPPAAAMANAHVLMVRRDSVPGIVEARLRQLNPRYVNVVGARNVLSDALWRDVRSILPRASIYRVGLNAGDRVDSALALAQHVKRDNGALREVFIIGRNGYSDGLATSNVAARIGGAIIPAMGDATQWASRVAPLLRGVNSVYFVGSGSVLPQSYWSALDARLPSHITMDRIGGPDRYATNAMMIDYFVPGISADRLYLVAGNGHGDTVGASLLAAQRDSVMMLSGRYCHDHSGVPEQVDRLEVERIVGIGTKFWITADALRLRVCGAGFYRGEYGPDPSSLQFEPMASDASFPRLQEWAGQRFGTFPAGTISGGAGEHEVQLPAGAGWGIIEAEFQDPRDLPINEARFTVSLHRDGIADERIISALDTDYDGAALLQPMEDQGPAHSLLVHAAGAWSLSVADLRHAPTLNPMISYQTGWQGRVALYDGPSNGVTVEAGHLLRAETHGFWSAFSDELSLEPNRNSSLYFDSGPTVVTISTPGAWGLRYFR